MADHNETRSSGTLALLRRGVSYFSSDPQKSIQQAVGNIKGENGEASGPSKGGGMPSMPSVSIGNLGIGQKGGSQTNTNNE